MTNTEIVKRRGGRTPLSTEEIEGKKSTLRNYLISHPDLTINDIFQDYSISKLFKIYNGKVERAIYDLIVGESNPKEISSEHFYPLVSYIVSKISLNLEMSNLSAPSIEDMKQDGIIGVLNAQEKYSPEYNSAQTLSYFRGHIRSHVWKGLEKSLSLVDLHYRDRADIHKLIFLCRYKFSAQEAKEIIREKLFTDHSNERTDLKVRSLKGKNLGLRTLRNKPDISEQEIEEDLTSVRQDLDILIGKLSPRYKEILLSKINGETFEEIGDNQPISISRQRAEWIEKESLFRLKRHIKSMLIMEDPIALRLYREYFDK